MASTTLKDLATRLGLSITTVSRALAGYDDVAEATRRRVLQAAAEMGYVPDASARRLQKGRTDTIGFIIPTFGPRFSDPFFSELLAGIGNEAARHNLDLLVSTRAPDTPEEEQAYRRMIGGHLVDGLLVVRTRTGDRRIAMLAAAGLPFVVFGRSDQDLDFCYVDEDGYRGFELMAEHLVRQGHRRLAFISAPPDLVFARYRRAGLVDTLERHGLGLPPEYCVAGDLTQRGGFQAMNQLLDLPLPPTAVVACNDLMALGAMGAAQRRGLVVGRDLAVAGFDDIPQAEHSHPSLTTVRQPIYEIGRQICAMLVQLVRGEELAERHVLLQPELIVRESSGAGPKAGSEPT
ncbi:MAG TPA: LacI family DNA-binding transcriptional regulator [Anaerolineae bacterium]|nr:LacI family DNA-binding transcriptional regulator [Anaerolineae bacterium]